MPIRREQQPVEAILVPERGQGLDRRYLKVADLRRFHNLVFSSRRRVEGLYAGRHATPQRGQSVEFRDYRPYLPGDELANVDWKVYGRSDRLFIKLFEHQAEMSVHLLVDGSASMAYSGLKYGQTKYDYACRLAAAIGFLVVQQSDRLAFAVAQGGLQEVHRPARTLSHLISILEAMERTKLRGEAHLADALVQYGVLCSRRSLLIVLSDLLDDREAVLKALARHLHRGGEAIVFHVLHQDELHLPPFDQATLIDSESGQRLHASLADLRRDYEQQFGEFLAAWSRSCQGHGIDYQRVITAEPYTRPLERYLFRRAAKS